MKSLVCQQKPCQEVYGGLYICGVGWGFIQDGLTFVQLG